MLIRLAGRLFVVPLLCLAAFSLLARPLHAQALEPMLVIGEVAWAGSSKSASDEWLELWNRSDHPIDLTGYTLEGASGSPLLLTGHVLPPQSAFLIANYAAHDPKSALAIDPSLVATAVSLSNESLQLRLLDDTGALVDELRGDPLPAGSSTPTKASMIRQQDGSWMTATTRDRLDQDVADFGTPGICDGCLWTEMPIATSTEPLPITSSSEPIVQLIDTPPPALILEPIAPPSPEPQIITKVITYPAFRLRRVFPAPPSGEKEWIEIDIPSGYHMDALDGYALYDASGRVTLFPPADLTLLEIQGSRIRIYLSSAKLNNSGDTVELRRPNGSIVERMKYLATPTGASWIKNAEETAWTLDHPVEEPAPIIEIVESPAPPTIELPTMEPVAPDEEPEPLEAKTPAPSPKPQPFPIPAAKSITAKKPTPSKTSTLLITHDMLTRLEPNIRVSIKGTVATKPGLLNKNHYILLAPDGYGLLVRGSSKQPTPALGQTVRVSGTLTLNDDGLSLGVGTKDLWVPADMPPEPPLPRPINFLDLQLEDGWSLAQVTGTVRETSTNALVLDLGDAVIGVKIKPVSGYRASRFKPGDVLQVRGLLDARGEDPAIIVRVTEDIELISHATIAAPKTPDRLPDWIPFGAAGMTIAVSEGYRHIKRIRQKHREKQLALRATSYATPSPQ